VSFDCDIIDTPREASTAAASTPLRDRVEAGEVRPQTVRVLNGRFACAAQHEEIRADRISAPIREFCQTSSS
jgi:hypothetical protein